MSGTSGSGDGGGFGAPPENCAALVIDTQLSSPKPPVIADIQVGDRLGVGLLPGEIATAVVVLSQGQVAGGLASPDVRRLRECINNGMEYVAVVTAKNEGQVRVRVKAK